MSNEIVKGVDFQELVSLSQPEALYRCVSNLPSTGLQATQVGRARRLVQRILYHRQKGDKVFLSYTSNLISSGLRDTFMFLAKERLVDAFITSAGGIEEDVIKCFGQTHVGKFSLNGKMLRKHGLNRIGNLLIPNDNYCRFEEFFMPVLRSFLDMQKASQGAAYTGPSDLITAIGRALESNIPKEDQETSLVYWCYKNNIPMFSPAITDGSIGDMVYFFSFKESGLILDPIQDVVNFRTLGASNLTDGRKNYGIILGGGLPKNHLLRNIQLDSMVLITTGLEADGCASSCTLENDIFNGLIKEDFDEIVRVQGDATLLFPLMLIKEN
ncbi:unnamed protein product [Phytomonas sp. Hart1]|nr:unnamed protein product [Phytomonas sp. Hart1]|eukprot:CCW67228.1 unnamed protein product [Phytomonas sp. isolate Hart1]